MMLRLLIVAALFGAIYGIQTRIEDYFGRYRATEEILYVDSGLAMKRVLLGFDNLAADLYWLRTVQYFGGKRLQAANKDYDLLEPLLNITIELDPNFKIAYSYGATFLSEPFPMGAGMPEKGIEIIDKGIAQHPENWRFYLDKGFIYFSFLNDAKKAAEIFLQGSELPGAPYWLVTVAGSMLSRSGERETARQVWQVMYENSETDQQRYNAMLHLRHLDALDEMDRLSEVVSRFHERTGRYPSGWKELIDAGFLTGLPVDPTGVVFMLDPASGTVDFDPSSDLRVLPRK